MSDDIVAELDRWLDMIPMRGDDRGTLRRARDEIVALRQTVERQRLVLSKGHAEVRAEALEEAAQYFDFEKLGVAPWKPEDIATAIRALKEQL